MVVFPVGDDADAPREFLSMRPNTMTRQQMISHLNTVASQWGIDPPKITDQTSDEALRRTVKRLVKGAKHLS